MIEVIIVLAFIFGLPILITWFMYLGQKSDFRKNRKVNESYDSFCKRNYTRYI